MPIVETTRTREELQNRLDELLAGLGISLDELNARRTSGTLTPEEWSVWEESEAIRYLLS